MLFLLACLFVLKQLLLKCIPPGQLFKGDNSLFSANFTVRLHMQVGYVGMFTLSLCWQFKRRQNFSMSVHCATSVQQATERE